MNIAIFETQHFECAYPMIRLMDIPGNNLTIFVNHEIYPHLEVLLADDMKRYRWIVKPAATSNRVFIWEMYQQCKKDNIELLFLNTVSAHFMLYAWAARFLSATKCIVTLHDVNSFLGSSFSINLRRTIRHAGKKLLGRFCYAYSTISETVRDHMIASMQVSKKIFCIPGAVFEEHRYVPINYEAPAAIRIVVAGTIDDRRRDYSQVMALLEYADKISLPILITLAGAPYGLYGRQVIHTFEAYARLKNNLIFFTGRELDQKTFESILNESHFIWNPSVIKTVIDDGIEETYGLTKSSGNIFDAIKHARPLLVPKQLAIPTGLMSTVFRYDSIEQIAAYLKQVVQHPGIYADLAKKALLNSTEYTVEKMRIRVKDLYSPSKNNLL